VAAVIGIKVKAAMTLAGFSQAELKDSAMQMRVRRMADKMRMKAPPSLFVSTLPPLHL
jgi:hypothetical protein